MHFENYDNARLQNQLSGGRFTVSYFLDVDSEAKAKELATNICTEQTVEFPVHLLPKGDIPSQILGQVESFAAKDGGYHVTISYAEELVGGEFTQLLNVIFGNISILPGIKVTAVGLTDTLLNISRGPRFGIDGLRRLIGVKDRPLLATALKPVGLASTDLAEVAYCCAENGIDIIKDDHGLANQVFAPYKERVRLCSEAVAKANARTGGNTLYVPNITTTADKLKDNALYAKEVGAGGVMVAPGLVGLHAMKALAEDDDIGLPVIAHPAFSGSLTINPQGIACDVLFGLLNRLCGADVAIIPNFGGRFSLSRQQCSNVATSGKAPLAPLKETMLAPAGGMSFDKIPEMIDTYGNNFVILIGGGLFDKSSNLAQNCREFLHLVEKEQRKAS